MRSHSTHQRPPRRTRRTPALVAVAAVASLCFGLTACGGDDTAASGSSQQASGSDNQADSFGDFQQCMADNGVDFGGGQGGERPSIDQDALQRAQEACGDLAPQGGGGPGGAGGAGGPGGGFDTDAIQAWTDCLADNGVEVDLPGAGGAPGGDGTPEPPADGQRPTPPDGQGPGDGSLFGLDTSDPEIAAAVDACQDLQPEFGPGQPGGSDGSDTSADTGESS